jgi:hypothetical protein
LIPACDLFLRNNQELHQGLGERDGTNN